MTVIIEASRSMLLYMAISRPFVFVIMGFGPRHLIIVCLQNRVSPALPMIYIPCCARESITLTLEQSRR